MTKFRYFIPLIFVSFSQVQGKGNISTCWKARNQQVEQTTYCRVKEGWSACLICPVSLLNKTNVMWKRGEEIIFNGEYRLSTGSFEKDQCHNSLSSLELLNVNQTNINETYQCSKTDTSSEFLVKYILVITTTPKLSIQNISFGEVSFLTCSVQNAYGPVILTWIVDANIERHENLYNSQNRSTSSTFNFTNTGESCILTCQVTGIYIVNTTLSRHLCTSKISSSGTESRVFAGILICVFVLVSGITAYLMLVRSSCVHQSQSDITLGISERQSMDNNSINTQVYATLNPGRDEIYVLEPTTVAPAVQLDEKIKSGSKFEYWKGSFTKHSGDVELCFIKTLSSDCTLKEAADFRRVAISLDKMKKHQHIVDIISILIENVPSINYELMEFGSLRNFIMTRYQEARQSRIFVDKMTSIPTSIRNEQDELLSFAYDVVRGMDFLAERKFCHPVLTTHKVLLTEDGRCKLYDIFPEAMAMLKVKQELNQEYPPVAWLAPEAIFMSDYTLASDVWNYAVFLWEVFSLGAIPYAGFRRSQLEEKIRNGNVLLQPINCPGALYNVMLTCWNMSKDKRPLIGSVKRQLQSAFDSFNEQYPAKISEGGTIYETCE